MNPKIEAAFIALRRIIDEHGLKATLLLIPEDEKIHALCSIDGKHIANAMTSVEIAHISAECQKKRNRVHG